MIIGYIRRIFCTWNRNAQGLFIKQFMVQRRLETFLLTPVGQWNCRTWCQFSPGRDWKRSWGNQSISKAEPFHPNPAGQGTTSSASYILVAIHGTQKRRSCVVSEKLRVISSSHCIVGDTLGFSLLLVLSCIAIIDTWSQSGAFGLVAPIVVLHFLL